jgi:hypothetical protein
MGGEGEKQEMIAVQRAERVGWPKIETGSAPYVPNMITQMSLHIDDCVSPL